MTVTTANLTPDDTDNKRRTTVCHKSPGKAPIDIGHNLAALVPRCTHNAYSLNNVICPHRNSDNLNSAISIGNTFVARGMTDRPYVNIA